MTDTTKYRTISLRNNSYENLEKLSDELGDNEIVYKNNDI